MWPEGHRDPGEAVFLWLSTLSLPGDSLSNWGLPQTAVVSAGPAPHGRPWAAAGVPEEWAGWVGQCQECSGAKPELAPSCAPAQPPLLIVKSSALREDERVWEGGPCDCSLQRLLPACSRSMASKEGGPSRRRRWWQRETSGNHHRY